MNHKKTISVLLIIFSATIFASGQDHDPCNVQGGGVTAGHLCVAQKIKSADAQLNFEYQEALKRMKIEEAELRKNAINTELAKYFRLAQRAWLKFRDAECNFIGISSTPSPWQGVQVQECALRMTRERTAYFKNIYLDHIPAESL